MLGSRFTSIISYCFISILLKIHRKKHHLSKVDRLHFYAFA
jgi:hypothetical protein